MSIKHKVTLEKAGLSKINLTGVDPKSPSILGDVLAYLELLQVSTTQQTWLLHPIHLEKETKGYYLDPNNQLNRLFCTGTLQQQIKYLSYMGVTDAIDRRPELRTAVNYHKFRNRLVALGIEHFNLADLGRALSPITRIHAVHEEFLDDEEILSGLYIPQSKRSGSTRAFVCCPQTLKLAIDACAPGGAKLIIDGHWEHNKRSTHGVWEFASAEDIADDLRKLLTAYPGKVAHIKLLGCQAGRLKEAVDISPDGAKVRFSNSSGSMAAFRMRGIHMSLREHSLFHPLSLAGKIVDTVPVNKVTATHTYTYPMPPDGHSVFNIASDSPEWRDEHFWSPPGIADSKGIDGILYSLHRLKSLTHEITPYCTGSSLPDTIVQTPSSPW